jgi:hypothetical protein
MLKLLKYTIGIFTVLIAAVGIALLIGRNSPMSDRLTFLHLTECAPPCWLGIELGVTYIEDAKKRILEVYNKEFYVALIEFPTIQMLRIRPIEISDYKSVNIDLSPNENKPLQAISLSFEFSFEDTKFISISEVLSYMGSPDVIYLTDLGYSSWSGVLTYKNNPHFFILFRVLNDNRINFNTSPGYIVFCQCEYQPNSSNSKPIKWRGFTTFQNMLRDTTP